MTEEKPKFTNRLINEKSPYLLQHAHNPVDWYPWGEEAFKAAKEKDKLIFVSIGYSTCHWCHVMAHESFENEEIAKIMNDLFINIKIDREERPDIDKIYMTYITEISGSGGWPASIWVTPNLEPITGGTYYAPTPKYGRPGFPTICERINKAWKTDRDMVVSRANTFIEFLKEEKPKGDNTKALSENTIELCHSSILTNYDEEFGGFSHAPKFPRTSVFNFLHSTHNSFPGTLEKLHFTLEMMSRGGIYDQIGGGFHRYSVTEDWKVPHFEKMLYDQGQIASVYLDAYQVSNNTEFEKVSKGILNYVQRDLTHPLGGFYSAEDADSLNLSTNEKQEGAFYVWSMDELNQLLTQEESDVFSFIYGCGNHGNVPAEDDPHQEFTDKNIVMRVRSNKDTQNYFKFDSEQQVDDLHSSAVAKLLDYRSKNRPRPHLDDKIITAWNALMISAFSKAYRIFPEMKSYLDSAEKSLNFIKTHLYDESSQTLTRNYKDGPSIIKGFGDDYAFLIQALLDTYESTFKFEYLQWAIDLQTSFDRQFNDEKLGGYFSTSGEDKTLLSRMKEEHDGAEPSCQSIAVCNLIRLYNITKVEKYQELAKSTFESCSLYLEKAPSVTPQMVVGLQHYLENYNTIIIVVQNKTESLPILRILNNIYKPNKSVLVKEMSDNNSLDYFANHTNNLTFQSASNLYNQPTVYICNSNGCLSPQYDTKQIESLFKNLK